MSRPRKLLEEASGGTRAGELMGKQFSNKKFFILIKQNKRTFVANLNELRVSCKESSRGDIFTNIRLK